MKKSLIIFVMLVSLTSYRWVEARRLRINFADEILNQIQHGQIDENFLSSLPSDMVRIYELNSGRKNSNCMGYVMSADREVRPHEFYSFLASYQEIPPSQARPGDIIVYTKSGYPQHAGFYIGNGWVRSKWSTGGPVLEHRLDFIPTPWEGTVTFYGYAPENINQDIATPEELFEFLKTGKPFSQFKKRLPPGIKIIENSQRNLDCFGFILKRDINSADVAKLFAILEYEHPVEMPAERDLIVYFDQDGLPIHVGIYVGDGKVISKWGYEGPVFEHEIEFVPPEWRYEIKFYRIDIEKIFRN